jgi:hypothetical protein
MYPNYGKLFGLVLAFSPLIDNLAYIVAGLPFALIYALYRMRK